MAKVQIPIVGAITGPVHGFNTRVLTDGRSLHPLQRNGAVAHTQWPSIGVHALPGVSTAPPAAGHQLGYPNRLNPSITSATQNPATRV